MRGAALVTFAILSVGGVVPVTAQTGPGHWRPEDRVLVTDFGFVTALARSSDRLFAATSGGLLVNRDVFRRWEPPVTREDGWPDVEVTAMAWDRLDRMLWLAVAGGRLLSLDPVGVRWTDDVRLGRPVDRIVPDGSAAGGLYLRTPGGWLQFDTFTQTARSASLSEVNDAIERNPNERARRELITSPGFESVQAFLGTGPDGRRWPITDVVAAGDPGRFWIGAAGGGLSLLDSFSFDWRPVGVGLLGLGARALAADGNAIWIAAGEPLVGRYGVTRVSEELEDWEVFDSRGSPGIPDRGIGAMTAVDGQLWIVGERGVTRRGTDGRWSRIAADYYDRGDRLRAIAIGEVGPDGRRAVWIGGDRGLDRMPDLQSMPERVLSGDRVSALLPVAGGTWAATDRGLVFLDDAGRRTVPAGLPAFPSGAVTGDGATTWTAIDSEVWAQNPDGSWRRLDEVGALSSPVTALAESQGILWIGTSDELVSWETDGRGPVRRYSFAAGDLPFGPFGERGIAAILPVSRSRVWVATPAGALRLDSPY
ncbi:MAG: hypothetical protein M8843_01390 [marine benthic group bacterium]|nr:hypothetical protein [Gemmatimonadota bacterium]